MFCLCYFKLRGWEKKRKAKQSQNKHTSEAIFCSSSSFSRAAAMDLARISFNAKNKCLTIAHIWLLVLSFLLLKCRHGHHHHHDTHLKQIWGEVVAAPGATYKFCDACPADVGSGNFMQISGRVRGPFLSSCSMFFGPDLDRPFRAHYLHINGDLGLLSFNRKGRQKTVHMTNLRRPQHALCGPNL